MKSAYRNVTFHGISPAIARQQSAAACRTEAQPNLSQLVLPLSQLGLGRRSFLHSILLRYWNRDWACPPLSSCTWHCYNGLLQSTLLRHGIPVLDAGRRRCQRHRRKDSIPVARGTTLVTDDHWAISIQEMRALSVRTRPWEKA